MVIGCGRWLFMLQPAFGSAFLFHGECSSSGTHGTLGKCGLQSLHGSQRESTARNSNSGGLGPSNLNSQGSVCQQVLTVAVSSEDFTLAPDPLCYSSPIELATLRKCRQKSRHLNVTSLVGVHFGSAPLDCAHEPMASQQKYSSLNVALSI